MLPQKKLIRQLEHCIINILFLEVLVQSKCDMLMVNGNALIFSKYGRVKDVYLMRDEKKQSRGMFPTYMGY
ncbi:hypothetical protein JHK85_013088 [Glycine max]|nr:hypothetical protein JHK87_012643 [Glycine soja]KAG5040612.1 hypothetical protein JHK85_013088 [Glycine max]